MGSAAVEDGETIGDSDTIVVHLIAKSQVLRCCGTIGLQSTAQPGGGSMSHVTYQIVQHDGGWAYKVDGVFSEPFPTHADALAAAKAAAEEQMVPGHSEVIEYEDEKGKWHTETAPGSDRPETDVKDSDG
jgi:hypothetical protein